MHANAEAITRFYERFQARDGAAMGELYAEDVRFSDPVFPGLEGWRVVAMWRMLCERGKDLRLEFSGVEADDTTGRAHWEAWYTFSATGRQVHNVIDATFVFRDGRAVEHTDRFDFWRWSGQALGPVGTILGWAPPVRNTVRRKAAGGLDEWIEKRGVTAENVRTGGG
jgi:ketosteroid isomerase-like protein